MILWLLLYLEKKYKIQKTLKNTNNIAITFVKKYRKNNIF